MAWVCSDVFIFYFFYLLWPVLEVEEEREVVGLMSVDVWIGS